MKKLIFLLLDAVLAACVATTAEQHQNGTYACNQKCGMSCKNFSVDSREIIMEKIDGETYKIQDRVYKYIKTDDSDEKMYANDYEKYFLPGHRGPGDVPFLIVNEKTGIAYDSFDNLLCSINPVEKDKLFESEVYDCPAGFRDIFDNGPKQHDGFQIVKDNFGNYNIRNSHEPDWYSGHFYKIWGKIIDGKFYYGSPTGHQKGAHWIYIDREKQTAAYQIRDRESNTLKSESVCKLVK